MQTALPRRLPAALALAAWVLAAAVLAAVTVAGPLDAAGLTVDRLTAALVTLVTGVAALVAVFSTRYLQDDPRLGRFFALLAVTTAGTVVFTAAGSLAVLLGGWIVAGAGFAGLLAHRQDVPGGRDALRRTVAAFATGDLALLAATILVFATAGNVALDGEPSAALTGEPLAGLASVLLVVAALARCAQVPLHRWLPATVAAPTPVSALLHAGVVNAGGILLVRVAPVTGLSSAALALLLVAGTLSALYGTAVMLTRPDVKGALAHSTMAQMGFMLTQVALGAAAAAVVHLAGHAMYKATLFLGSGSAVGARRRDAAAPTGTPVAAPARAAAALLVPLAALAAAVALVGGTGALGGDEALVLLAFAWASGAHALDGWLRTGPPRALLAGTAATLAAAGAYVGLLAAVKSALGAALPTVPGVDPLLAAPLALAVAAATVARVLNLRVDGARATVYAWLLDSGVAGRTPAWSAPATSRAEAVPAGEPQPQVAS